MVMLSSCLLTIDASRFVLPPSHNQGSFLLKWVMVNTEVQNCLSCTECSAFERNTYLMHHHPTEKSCRGWGGGYNVSPRDEEECCKMLSSGYDTPFACMNSQRQPLPAQNPPKVKKFQISAWRRTEFQGAHPRLRSYWQLMTAGEKQLFSLGAGLPWHDNAHG